MKISDLSKIGKFDNEKYTKALNTLAAQIAAMAIEDEIDGIDPRIERYIKDANEGIREQVEEILKVYKFKQQHND